MLSGKERHTIIIAPDCEEITKFAKYCKRIPLCRGVYADVVTPITLLHRTTGRNTRFYLLESIEGGETQGCYSFLGFNPVTRLTCKNGAVDVEDSSREEHTRRSIRTSKPLDVLWDIPKDHKAPVIEGLPPFIGGFVGYFSYSMIQYAEPTLELKQDDDSGYDLVLFDKVIVYDHLKQKISVVINMKTDNMTEQYGRACGELESIARLIQSNAPLAKSVTTGRPEFTCNVSKEDYCRMVERTKGYIVGGDIFQAVTSRQFSSPYKSSLSNIYWMLRTTNPSPHTVYMKLDDDEIISTSPETLVRLRQRRLTAFPVADSRPGGATPEEDTRLETELLTDEEELAEHSMLVDLRRNGLGRVSKFSTVEVTGYKMIRRYPRIMHIYSQVKDDIRLDYDGCSAIEAMLPAEALSGAPKIRACEIIDELEQVPRSIYGGVLGYLDFAGNMDTCIAIRVATKRDHKVYVQAGNGIVADSVPELEYEESANKAEVVVNTILEAREVND